MARGELKVSKLERDALAILNSRYLESGKTHQQIADDVGISRTSVLKSLAGDRATTYSEFVGISHSLGLRAWKVMQEVESKN